MSRATVLLVALALLSEVNVYELATGGTYLFDKDLSKLQRYIAADKEYNRHIDWMINVHGGATGGRVFVKTLMDTKIRAWKRNADVINSLLALPKGMTAAGR